MKAELKVVEGPRTTIALLTIDDGEYRHTYVADAKRHPKDKNDPMIGVEYAVGRVFAKVSEALLNTADFRVSISNLGK